LPSPALIERATIAAMKPRLVMLALVVVAVAVIACTSRESGSWDTHQTPQAAVKGVGGRTLGVGYASVLRTEQETDSTGKQVSSHMSERVADFKQKLVRYDRFAPEKPGSFLTIVLAGDMFYGRVPSRRPSYGRRAGSRRIKASSARIWASLIFRLFLMILYVVSESFTTS